MDFFEVLFEDWYHDVTQPFESIKNPVAKGIWQIVGMAIFCAVHVGLCLAVVPLIGQVYRLLPFAENQGITLLIKGLALFLCLLITGLLARGAGKVISFFMHRTGR